MENIINIVITWAGICGYSMVLFTVLSGLKIIKVKFKVHKTIGIIAGIVVTLHAMYMMYNYFFA